MKISNVTLGYDLKKLIKAIPLAQARFFASIQNLHTFTKYSGMDPEIGITMVMTAGQKVLISDFIRPREPFC